MTVKTPGTLDLDKLSPETFKIETLEDEIRVDRLCVEILSTFFNVLTDRSGQRPEVVGGLCHGTDYFLREFVIPVRRDNPLQMTGQRIRQFAGHWYIVKTLEPNMTELSSILDGIAAFYLFLAERALIDQDRADEICEACAEREWYQERIEDFWAIEGDGYLAWRNVMPL